jgi:hypothetical protein
VLQAGIGKGRRHHEDLGDPRAETREEYVAKLTPGDLLIDDYERALSW